MFYIYCFQENVRPFRHGQLILSVAACWEPWGWLCSQTQGREVAREGSKESSWSLPVPTATLNLCLLDEERAAPASLPSLPYISKGNPEFSMNTCHIRYLLVLFVCFRYRCPIRKAVPLWPWGRAVLTKASPSSRPWWSKPGLKDKHRPSCSSPQAPEERVSTFSIKQYF